MVCDQCGQSLEYKSGGPESYLRVGMVFGPPLLFCDEKCSRDWGCSQKGETKKRVDR